MLNFSRRILFKILRTDGDILLNGLAAKDKVSDSFLEADDFDYLFGVVHVAADLLRLTRPEGVLRCDLILLVQMLVGATVVPHSLFSILLFH